MHTVTIRNDVPRRDTDGNIVDAHEPCLEPFDGRFYMYGAGYADHSGWTPDNCVNCYSSPDLQTWEFHGTLFPPGRQGIPCLKRNPNTGRFVLWHSRPAGYCVSVSDTPTGPFETVHEPVQQLCYRRANGFKTGDFTLFVDDDGTGYLAYTVRELDSDRPWDNHQIFIERLTDDYLGGTGEICGSLAWNCEAPAMFRRGGLYYVLFGNTCCWCPAGTGCRVYTATAPLGPYTYRGDINRTVHEDPRKIASRSSDTEPGDGRTDVIIPMQTRRIAELPTPDGTAYVVIGDRWESAPDGVKGHDYTYWTSPLEFDEDGMIRRLQWEDRWSITLDI